jgi:hypothetical protein
MFFMTEDNESNLPAAVASDKEELTVPTTLPELNCILGPVTPSFRAAVAPARGPAST